MLLTLLALSALVHANVADTDRSRITLASGFDMLLHQYPSDGDSLLIWLPSKYGIRPGNAAFAQAVQRSGTGYWLIDLHESYLAPLGRDGYAQFQPQHIKELIDHAVGLGWKHIVLGGESRGAALAMQAARLWQLENPGDARLKGMLFYHPYLVEGYTQIGEQARFLPITSATNLPTYIFQPQHNTKSFYSHAVIERLQRGGSAVFFHPLQGVRGGFHVREDEDLYAREIDERAIIGTRVRKAINLLTRMPTPPRAAEQTPHHNAFSRSSDNTSDTLVPLELAEVPALDLSDELARAVSLDDFTGDIVLLNFWATWCGPCVDEMASLIRLAARFENQPFRVLAINVGESRQHVASFLAERGIKPNFPLLFDTGGKTAENWRVYAVPSTYLLDATQRIRYGYRGALAWDKPSVVSTVESLLK